MCIRDRQITYGFPIRSEVHTMPLDNVETRGRLKKVDEIILWVRNAFAFDYRVMTENDMQDTEDENGLPVYHKKWERWSSRDDTEQLEPYEGVVRVKPSATKGYVVIVQIRAVGAWPLEIQAIQSKVEVDDV